MTKDISLEVFELLRIDGPWWILSVLAGATVNVDGLTFFCWQFFFFSLPFDWFYGFDSMLEMFWFLFRVLWAGNMLGLSRFAATEWMNQISNININLAPSCFSMMRMCAVENVQTWKGMKRTWKRTLCVIYLTLPTHLSFLLFPMLAHSSTILFPLPALR